ncbi:MAG: TraR/DksA family transcriptional regulator [Acidobacteria bacterium]|nr:MAG: TraR/DksA family transcriptional regulator [Acidobacteriota bacterium]
MDKRSLEKYRTLLEEKRGNLLKAYTRKKSLGSEVGGKERAADIVDMATDASTQEFLYSMSNSDRELLKAVENALTLMENDDFGECVECEERISKKRLDAVPWARYCVSCQELVETGRLRV